MDKSFPQIITYLSSFSGEWFFAKLRVAVVDTSSRLQASSALLTIENACTWYLQYYSIARQVGGPLAQRKLKFIGTSLIIKYMSTTNNCKHIHPSPRNIESHMLTQLCLLSYFSMFICSLLRTEYCIKSEWLNWPCNPQNLKWSIKSQL